MHSNHAKLYLRRKREINRAGVATGSPSEELGVEVDLEREVRVDEEEHLMEELMWYPVRADRLH